MNHTVIRKKTKATLPGSYAALVERLVPRKIHTDDQYEEVAAMVDRLALLPKRNQDQDDYLDLLSDLIAAYDEEHYPTAKGTGIDLLNNLLELHEMSVEDLAKILKTSVSLAYKIKSGTRNLTVGQITLLAAYFKVHAEALMRK